MKKNRLSIALIVTVITSMIVIFAMVSSSAALMGDINRDGYTNSSDARAILRVAAKIDPPFDADIAKIADVNGDGLVQSVDARLVLRMAAKIDPTPTIPEGTKPDMPGSKIDRDCYLDVDIVVYAKDGKISTQNIKTASQTIQSDANTLNSVYFRSEEIYAGHDVGTIIREKMVDGVRKQDYYIVNYETNEYLVLDSELLEKIPGVKDKLLSYNWSAFVSSITVFDDVELWNAKEGMIDGVSYQIVTIDNEDGSSVIYYLHQVEGRDFYEPAKIVQFDKDGNMTSVVTVNAYDPDPTSYLNPSAEMKGIRFQDKGVGVAGIKKFAESIGIKVS